MPTRMHFHAISNPTSYPHLNSVTFLPTTRQQNRSQNLHIVMY